MLEENPPWKIIPCWSLDREINWPSNWPVLEAVATTAKRWSNGGWENNVNWSERDRRTRADKRTSDRLNPMNERDTRWNWDGPITRLHPFAWDVQRWWHDISDISPWIHSISVDRKSMCIQSPRTAIHPRLGFLHRLPRVFSDIFAMYFTFHGKLTRTRRGRIPARHVQGIMTHYRKWRMGE